jgi:hypothetical protein
MHIPPGRRLSYANVVSTLALVFAMSGGALAASHYLINSTKQINPKVLKSLKGKTGAKGPTGAAGSAGAQGGQGPSGAAGAAGSAVAFAHITALSEPKAMLDTANSKNVSAVSEGQKGLYCITTTVPVKNVTGNTDAEFSTEHPEVVQPNFGVVPLAIALKLCPSSTSVIVTTLGSTGKQVPADFWVNFN